MADIGVDSLADAATNTTGTAVGWQTRVNAFIAKFKSGVNLFGTAALKNVGTATGNIPEVQADGKLPSGVLGGAVPTGGMMSFAGSTSPTGWLICDGQAVSRTQYAALFGVIGTTYGNGDGTATFTLPDLRRRVPVGAGGARVAGPATSLASRAGSESATTSDHTHFVNVNQSLVAGPNGNQVHLRPLFRGYQVISLSEAVAGEGFLYLRPDYASQFAQGAALPSFASTYPRTQTSVTGSSSATASDSSWVGDSIRLGPFEGTMAELGYRFGRTAYFTSIHPSLFVSGTLEGGLTESQWGPDTAVNLRTAGVSSVPQNHPDGNYQPSIVMNYIIKT